MNKVKINFEGYIYLVNPCPFCGKTAIDMSYNASDKSIPESWVVLRCIFCYGRMCAVSAVCVAEDWNRRAYVKSTITDMEIKV